MDQAAAAPVVPASEAPPQTDRQVLSQEDRFQSLVDRGILNSDAPAAAAPDTSAPSQEDASAATADPEYSSFEDFAGKNKFELESLYSLPLTVKIDGKTSNVPLRDVLKGYQLEGHVQEKSRALAEQRQQWESERTAAQQALGAQLQQAQVLGNLAHQQLLAEYQGINWNQLRIDDPAGWAVKNQEFQNRANQIAGHLNQVQQHQQQLAAAQQQELTSKVIPAEQERMYDSRPEWRDTTKFQADTAAMKQYATKLGFKPAELAGIYDHRIMIALHDAARYAALQAASPEALKRVRAAPQAVQPGSRQSRDPNAVAHQQAREAWARDPRNEDAAAAVFQRYA